MALSSASTSLPSGLLQAPRLRGNTVTDPASTATQMSLLLPDTRPSRVTLSPGAIVLRGFALPDVEALHAAIKAVTAQAPLRTMQTPGGGTLSAAMTNCGALGWVTDKAGYRYTPQDPLSHLPWPPLPALFAQMATCAAHAAGFPGFHPNACLINRYEAASRMGLHQDKDEKDFTQPIVSVSLGLPIHFLWGGLTRTVPPFSFLLEHGDVVVWGGKARLHYHGVKPLAAGQHPLTGPYRFNLTFRFVAP